MPSAGLWAVAFVLDGFGAPVYAEALASADSPEVSAALLTAFRANAAMMSRLGLVSWVVGGVGMGRCWQRDTWSRAVLSPLLPTRNSF